MASRMIAPKLASMMASSATKVARPAVRSSMKLQKPAERSFSAIKSTSSPVTLAARRAQTSNILSAVNKTSKRAYSSEIASAMVQVSQNLGMGSAAIGLGGAGIGIGLVFASLLTAVARNPALRGQLFTYAILGFAFVEAIGLFDLMVAMMCKFL